MRESSGVRKSRSRVLWHQRWKKVTGVFGLSSKVLPVPRTRTVGTKAGAVVKRKAVVEEALPQYTEDGTLIAQRTDDPSSSGLLALASVPSTNLEALDEAHEEARRASRRAALWVSLLMHIILLGGLATYVLPARLDPPSMVVTVPEKEEVDRREQLKQKLKNMSSVPKPKASISLPKVVSNIASPVAAPKVDVQVDEMLASAMPATGIGLGRGVMNFGGNFKGMAIGGMMVRSKKLGVVLDSSPSMTPHLPALRAEIRRNFRGSVFKEIKGCTLAATNGRDATAIVTFYDPVAVMVGIKELVTEHKIDALYWFCDLHDQQTDAALDELEKMLTGGFPGRRVRFYVRSVDLKPSKRLATIIDRSGGEVEVGPVR